MSVLRSTEIQSAAAPVVRLRTVLGLARVAAHLILAALIIAFCFAWIGAARRARLIHWWSRRVLTICGLQLRVEGSLSADGRGAMLLLNHVSWTDIYLMLAQAHVRFVAKSEIRSWPLIGYLCDRVGTMFIERGRRHAVHEANRRIAQVMREGGLVGVFPEGTTTDGTVLLPFHANLCQAAIEADVPIQPVALRYYTRRGLISLDAAYAGETTMFQSICLILNGAPIVARVTLLAPIEPRGMTRHQLAQAARAAIAASLGVDTEDTRPVQSADQGAELL